jgi:carbonic anhydrase/acetyltransferase-like protein (isoleucine patch superfamily)
VKVENRLETFLGQQPTLGVSCYVAPTATVVGDVRVGSHSSIWYGCVLRGDINYISIGESSNLQDGVIGHLADDFPLEVGNFVTVGHGAILHACRIEDECLIGMGATILDGATIGRQSIVAAGTVVPVGMQVPPGSLVAGVPGQLKKPLPQKKREILRGWAEKYLAVKEAHRKRGKE